MAEVGFFALAGEVAEEGEAADNGVVCGDLIAFEVSEEKAAAGEGLGDGGFDVGDRGSTALARILFVFEVDDFATEELGEGGVASGEAEGPIAGGGVVAEGEVGDGLFDQFASFGFGEVTDGDGLGVDEVAGPALEFLEGVAAGEEEFEAGAMLDQVAKHAEDGGFVEFPFVEGGVEGFEFIEGEEDAVVPDAGFDLIEPVVECDEGVCG